MLKIISATPDTAKTPKNAKKNIMNYFFQIGFIFSVALRQISKYCCRIIESCLSKTPQAPRITAPAPNPLYIAHGWRRYPKYARMALFGYPKTGFHFAAINSSSSSVLKIACVLLLLLIFPFPGQAKGRSIDNIDTSWAEKEGKDTGTNYFTDLSFESNNNVFGLSDSQKTKLTENDPKDINSNRYKDMDSISDYIIAPTIGAKVSSKNSYFGKFDLTSWIKYNYYKRNEKSSFSEGRIRLKRSSGKHGKLALEGNFTSKYFKKNYLSGVVDTNSNGNIKRDERIYSAAVYDEYEGKISYEHTLLKKKHKFLSRIILEPFAGYRCRKYNSEFNNRNFNLPFEGVGFAFKFASRIDLGIKYQHDQVLSGNGQELFLYDETISGIDCNGDGKIRANAPCISKIDRSSNRNTLEINPSVKLTEDASLFLGYSKRTESYTSDNSLDIKHYNQDGYRRQVKSGFKYNVSKNISALIEYSKTDNEDGDDDKYSENKFIISLKIDLN